MFLLGGLLPTRQLYVPAKLKTHRRQYFVLEIRFSTRTETLIERGRKNWHWHAFIDGGMDCPAPLARIRDAPGELRKYRILGECCCRQIEEPGGDDTASPPNFRDVGQMQIVLVVLR